MSPAVMIVIVGIGTYLLRLSVVGLVSVTGGVSPRVEQSLRLVAPAVLAALVADTLLLDADGIRPPGAWHVAGLVALAIAIRWSSAVWTMAGGMTCLWLITWLA